MDEKTRFKIYIDSIDGIATSIQEMVSQGPILDIPTDIIPAQVLGSYNRMLLVSCENGHFDRQKTLNALAALDKALRLGQRKLLRTGKPENTLQFYSPVIFLWLADEEAPDHTIAGTIQTVLYKTLTLYLLSLFFTNIIQPIMRGDTPDNCVIIDQQTNLLLASESLEYSHIKLIESDRQLLKRHDGTTRIELELAVEKATYPQVLGGVNSRKISEREAELISLALNEILNLDTNQALNLTALVELVRDYMIDRSGRIDRDITIENIRTEDWFKQYIKKQYKLPEYLTKAGRRPINSVESATIHIREILSI